MEFFGQEVTLRKVAAALIFTLFVQGFFRLYHARSKFWALQSNHGLVTLPHSFLFGHLLLVGKALSASAPDAHQQLSMWLLLENYHPELWAQGFFYLDLWPVQYPLLTCFDPGLIAQFTQIESQPKSRILKDQLSGLTGGHDLVSSDGGEWKASRAVFNPGFSGKNILELVDSFVEEIEVFRRMLQDAADDGRVVKMSEQASKLAFDVIGNAVLGTRFHSLTKEKSFYTTFLKRLSWNFPDWSLHYVSKVMNPLRPFITRRLDRAINRELCLYINEALRPGGPRQGPKTILHLSTEAYVKQLPEDTALPRSVLDLRHGYLQNMLAHLRAFILAGFDTTAYALCAVFWQLHRNEGCLRMVREEHDRVFGKDVKLAAQMIRDNPVILNRLPYTSAVIKETMRVQPVTGTVREPEPGFVMVNPSTSQPLPTQGYVLFSTPHALHQNPRFWSRRQEFLPQRWLVPDGHELHPVKNAFRPFELGPRNCIGQEVVQMEMKAVMALTLREFDIVPQYDEGAKKVMGDLAYQVPGEVTTRPKDGLPVKIRRRAF